MSTGVAKRVVLTGGGSAGHVTPNLALVDRLRARGYNITYLGTRHGIERGLVNVHGIPFHAIHSGKLRRYFDLRNVGDVFLIALGILESVSALARLRPAVVFSKGGFVSCPVVWAAWLLRIPVVLHESDITPGLANRLCAPFARTVCYSFPEAAERLPSHTRVYTGLPVRETILRGCAAHGRETLGFGAHKPILLVIGGSLGARRLNAAVRAALPRLLQKYAVAHICGTGDEIDEPPEGYWQTAFVDHDLPHLLAAADVVLSRAGATTIFELLLLRKPMLLVPLGTDASRGDQIANAKSFRLQGFCHVLRQERMDEHSLAQAIDRTYRDRRRLVQAMKAVPVADGCAKALQEIDALALRV